MAASGCYLHHSLVLDRVYECGLVQVLLVDGAHAQPTVARLTEAEDIVPIVKHKSEGVPARYLDCFVVIAKAESLHLMKRHSAFILRTWLAWRQT